jgi:pimeloyl-ACP methyl ester carboxylesterase
MASENLEKNIENTLSFLKQCTARPLPPDELQVILAYSMAVPPQIRGHLLGRPAPYEDALKKISVPVLVSHGSEDQVALAPMAHYTGSVVSHAQCSLYEGVGHMPFWEAAPRFNRELAEFVTKREIVNLQ